MVAVGDCSGVSVEGDSGDDVIEVDDGDDGVDDIVVAGEFILLRMCRFSGFAITDCMNSDVSSCNCASRRCNN